MNSTQKEILIKSAITKLNTIWRFAKDLQGLDYYIKEDYKNTSEILSCLQMTQHKKGELDAINQIEFEEDKCDFEELFSIIKEVKSILENL